MELLEAVCGNAGPKIRSDCEIRLGIRNTGGVDIRLSSKVKALYGRSVTYLVKDILDFFKIPDAVVSISDSGALPYVIAARTEAAIKKLTGKTEEYLPEMRLENLYQTKRDRFRFTRLYLPGNSPNLMINAGLHKPDGIILDLEDSVAPIKKHEARFLVRNALRQVNFHGAERMVRINQGEVGLADLKFVIPHNVNVIIIPKCESREYIVRVVDEIKNIQNEQGIPGDIFLMPVIESALGVERAFEIAGASESIIALVLGLEDFTADLGVERSLEGRESFYARSRIVTAARAAGIQPIDSVFSDVSDMEALKVNVSESKALGFEGMGCIHPRQIAVIKDGFLPGKDELSKAQKIVAAWEEAEKSGLGVVSLGSKMIDPPVVKRAIRTLELAKGKGLNSIINDESLNVEN